MPRVEKVMPIVISRLAPTISTSQRALSCDDVNTTAVSGDEGEAGLEVAVAQYAAQELRQEEEHAEHARHQQQPGDVGARAVAVGEQPQRRDRRLGVQLGDDERSEQHRAQRERADGLGVAPAVGRRVHEGIDQGRHAQGRGERAGEVELAGRLRGLGQVRPGQDEQDDADRDVHEEHPAPRGPLREHAAGDQAERGAADGHRGVVADSAGALAGCGEHRHEQGQGRRRGERAADALDRARDEQLGRVLGEAAHERGDGEQPDAGQEHPATAEQVTGAGRRAAAARRR